MLQGPLSETVIRDSLAAVFRGAAYDRTIRQTILGKLTQWLGKLLRSIFGAVLEHPFLIQSAKVLLIVAAVAVAVRLIYLWYLRSRLSARARAAGAGGADSDMMQDPWLLSQRYASEGKYTEAAHAIYWHLLEWLAQREKLILHPSKTVGDYARDLRARSSRLFNHYRDFARSYEVVIYGLGSCDRERYDRLLSLATAITQKNG